MARITWDATGEHLYETGVRNAVLYVQNSGAYPTGVAWNGITAISESPSGADPTPLYADDIKYLNLIGTEEFGASIEAYTYPEEFGECDGTADLAPGVSIGQQKRKTFGLCYRTIVGNDVDGDEYGYKLHIIYGCTASPSEKGYQTINDSPDAISFSWEVNTVPVTVDGHKPTALVTIDSTKVNNPAKMAALEAVLYGVDAEAFDASKTYAIGDYCTNNTKTYVCSTAITTAGAWDVTKWTEVANPGPHLPLPAEIAEIMS